MRLQIYLLVFLFFIGACGGKPADNSRYVALKVYHTNDIHSHLLPNRENRGGLAYLASVLKVIREQEPEALILDAGDFYKKGSLPAYKSHDEVVADLIGRMPYYDARAVGNNEIKVGIPHILSWSKKKETAPLLSANFVDKDGKPVFKTHYLFKKNGLTVAVIGLTPIFDIEPQWQPPPGTDKRAPYKVVDGAEAVAPLIAKLRPQVDVLILDSHYPYWQNLKLAEKFKEVDLIVSGHTHVLTGEKKTTDKPLVVEAGEFGQNMGVAILNYDREEKKVVSEESTFWPIGPDLQVPDPVIQKDIESLYKKWAPEAFDKLAASQGTLGLIQVPSKMEGALHDWVADTLLSQSKADAAFVNREMLREAISKGPITRENLFLAVPYDNEAVSFKISRENFMAMFKESIDRRLPKEKLMPFGFSGVAVRLRNNEASLRVASNKPYIKVATVSYIVEHCTEFFAPRFCPIKGVQKEAPDVHKLIEQAMVREKVIHPPPLERVSTDSD